MKALIAAILMCCLMTGQVMAQPTNEAETIATQAKDSFKAGDYDVAAKLYMAAYAKSHAPALIFNAARAYEEGGKKADSVAMFRMYISLSKDEGGVADAKSRIAKLEIVPDTTSIVVVPQPVVAPAPVAVKPKPRAIDVVKPQKFAGPDHTTAWLTAGGSVVLVGAGIGLMADGASGTQKYTGVNRASFDSAKTEWWVGMGLVSAGAIVGGVSAYLWTRSPVTMTPTTNGVAVSGNF